jgi:DNA-binding ferritin-like protein
MHVSSIISFNCDWNEEVVAQFYATLYINRSTKTFHWTIQGKPFYVEYAYFASILGFSNDDLLRERIHEMENVLEDGELHFMYD